MAKNNDIRKLTITGSTQTYYVTIPKNIIRDLKWRRGQRIIVNQRAGKITLKALKPI